MVDFKGKCVLDNLYGFYLTFKTNFMSVKSNRALIFNRGTSKLIKKPWFGQALYKLYKIYYLREVHLLIIVIEKNS